MLTVPYTESMYLVEITIVVNKISIDDITPELISRSLTT